MKNSIATLSPARVYLAIALPVSLFFCFLTPPFMVADEGAHFYRAFEISEGHFVSTRFDPEHSGGMLPRSLYDTVMNTMGGMAFHPEIKVSLDVVKAEFSRALNPNDRIQILYQCQALYSPVTYIPSALGIILARALNLSPLAMLYFGRILTCLAAVVILFTALRLTPILPWLMTILALLPMVYFQNASISADAITVGITFLFAAICWRLVFSEQALPTRKWAIALILTTTAMCLSKQAYFPVILLLGFANNASFNNRIRLKWTIILAATLISLSLMILWGHLAQSIWTPARLDIHVNPSEQLQYMKDHPWRFLGILADTIWADLRFYWVTLIGGLLGWQDLEIPTRFLKIIGISILVTAVLDGSPRLRFSWPMRLTMLAIGIGIPIMIIVWQYLSWNAPGADYISGPSGRYFIPVAPILFGTLSIQRNRYGFLEKLSRFIPAMVIGSGLYSAGLVAWFSIRRFYM